MYKLFKFFIFIILSFLNLSNSHTNQICTSTGGTNNQCVLLNSF